MSSMRCASTANVISATTARTTMVPLVMMARSFIIALPIRFLGGAVGVAARNSYLRLRLFLGARAVGVTARYGDALRTVVTVGSLVAQPAPRQVMITVEDSSVA